MRGKQSLVCGKIHIWVIKTQLSNANEFFTNTQSWQHWHYCQLVLPYVCSFLFYFHHLKLVNLKLEIKGYWGLHLMVTCLILMTELKQSWQCWYSWIAESLWKTLLFSFQWPCSTSQLSASEAGIPWTKSWVPRLELHNNACFVCLKFLQYMTLWL